jgi:hypothetical protein
MWLYTTHLDNVIGFCYLQKIIYLMLGSSKTQFGGLQQDNIPWPQSWGRCTTEWLSGGAWLLGKLSSPSKPDHPGLFSICGSLFCGFGYSAQPLFEPLSAKIFGFGNSSLCLWANDVTFSFWILHYWSLWVGGKICLSFLGHQFSMVVDLFVLIICQQILQLSIYFNPFQNNKQIHLKEKKNP